MKELQSIFWHHFNDIALEKLPGKSICDHYGSKSTKVETSKLGNGIYILEIKMRIDVVKRKLVVSN